ncbi:MAG: hypothetical protein L3K08_01060 [Thermoplasmata archaeon]|nr:hypothetical protein [Thermoplasmata archaeon]
MSTPRRGLATPSTPRTGVRYTRTAALLAMAALLILPIGPVASAAGPVHSPVSASTRASPSEALGAAAASLADGGGPARGSPGVCAFSSTGSASCQTGASPSSPPIGPRASEWTNLSANATNPPSGRILGSMVWDAYDGYVLLFGGCSAYTCNGGMDGDTWAFQNGQWVQLNPSNSPSARAISATAYDPADHEVVLFGGLGSTPAAGCAPSCVATNDTWTFSGGQWTNLTPNLTVSPSGRYRAAMTYDAADGYVVMFGGTTSSAVTGSALNDTWTFVNQKWKQITPKGHPVPRFRADMAYDAADGYAVLFGGCQFIAANPCATSQTWTYLNLVWTNETKNESSSPNPRVYFGIAYDGRDGALLLVDGGATSGGPPVGGTWSFVLGQWKNLSSGLTIAPAIRAEVMLAPDPVDNSTLFFGGYNGTPLNPTLPLLSDTWGFGAPVYANAHLSPRTIDLHQSAALKVYAEANARPVGFWYSSLPSPCASANSSALSCAPGFIGSYRLRVAVNDSLGDSANASVNLSVVPDPSVSSYGVVPNTVTSGSMVNISVAATGGAVPYHYGYQHLPGGCGTVDRNYLDCSPSAAGTYTIEVQVTDAAAYSIFDNTSLRVNPRPGVTQFVAEPPVIDLGQSTVLNLSVANGTGPFTYQYSGLPNGCASANTSALTCTPKRTGPWSVFGEATDAFGYSTNSTAALTVNAKLAIFDFGLSSGGVIDVGKSVELWLNATSGTAPYSYFYYGLPTGCVSSNASSVLCTPAGPGNSTITGNVTDGVGVYRTVTYNLSVRARPTIQSVVAAPVGVDIGVATNLTVLYSGGTAPFGLLYSGLPGGCASANIATLGCIPQVAGVYTVMVVLTDAFGDHASSTVVVTVNPDPQITGFGASPSTFQIGSSTSLKVNVSGGTGAVQYVYQGLPTGCAPSDTGTLACTPTGTGTFTVHVTITDSLGQSASARAEIIVQPQVSASPGPGLGGASGTGLDLLIAGVAVAILAVGIAALLLRRRRSDSAENAADPGEVVEPSPSPWDEDVLEPEAPR